MPLGACHFKIHAPLWRDQMGWGFAGLCCTTSSVLLWMFAAGEEAQPKGAPRCSRLVCSRGPDAQRSARAPLRCHADRGDNALSWRQGRQFFFLRPDDLLKVFIQSDWEKLQCCLHGKTARAHGRRRGSKKRGCNAAAASNVQRGRIAGGWVGRVAIALKRRCDSAPRRGPGLRTARHASDAAGTAPPRWA